MADDPSGVFNSDEHRRVAAFLADGRDTPDLLADELTSDEHTRGEFTPDDVESLLRDLEADGDVQTRKNGTWSRTARGTKRLGE